MASDVNSATSRDEDEQEATQSASGVVEEVAEDLFRIRVPLPYDPRVVNVWVERGPDGALVVDAGTNDQACREAISAGFKQIGLDLADINQIVITHAHIDHYGLVGWLAEMSGAPIRMHGTATFLLERHWRPESWIHEFERFLLRHGTPTEHARNIAAFEDWGPWLTRFPGYTSTRDEETIAGPHRRWAVVHTPGHTADHICLWSPEDRILISGDHVLPTYTPHLRYVTEDLVDPVGSFARSLERVRRLDPDLVLPGHGPPMKASLDRIDELLRIQDDTERELLDFMSEPRTAHELALLHHGERVPQFHFRLAVQQMVAYVRHLQLTGRVIASMRSGVVYFTRSDVQSPGWPWDDYVSLSEDIIGGS